MAISLPFLSRRDLLGSAIAGSALPARRNEAWRFDLWWAAREGTLLRLEATSEDEPGYEPLMDELARLEGLIFETPSQAPAALRAKGRLLLWLMEQERHDGLAAMRHIAAYLDTLR